MKTEFITVTELASILKVPTGTIYYWVSTNSIPFIKFGKHIRFEIEKVLQHFDSRPFNKK